MGTFTEQDYADWEARNQERDDEWVEQMLAYYENKQESGVPLMCI